MGLREEEGGEKGERAGCRGFAMKRALSWICLQTEIDVVGLPTWTRAAVDLPTEGGCPGFAKRVVVDLSPQARVAVYLPREGGCRGFA